MAGNDEREINLDAGQYRVGVGNEELVNELRRGNKKKRKGEGKKKTKRGNIERRKERGGNSFSMANELKELRR